MRFGRHPSVEGMPRSGYDQYKEAWDTGYWSSIPMGGKQDSPLSFAASGRRRPLSVVDPARNQCTFSTPTSRRPEGQQFTAIRAGDGRLARSPDTHAGW